MNIYMKYCAKIAIISDIQVILCKKTLLHAPFLAHTGHGQPHLFTGAVGKGDLQEHMGLVTMYDIARSADVGNTAMLCAESLAMLAYEVDHLAAIVVGHGIGIGYVIHKTLILALL